MFQRQGQHQRAIPSATEIADHLRHEDPSLTMGTYMNTLRGGTKPATALQEQVKGLL